MPGPGYAVIDFETTGIYAEGTDRAAEVAVVHLSPSGEITGEWETLINPHRDLGPALSRHHIRASEIMKAPDFREIAPYLVELLGGRVIVGHNVVFDLRFLAAELNRAGYSIRWRDLECIDTLILSGRLLEGSGRSLVDCCAAFDIDLTDAHRASADAHATAQLLSLMISSIGANEYWDQKLFQALAVPWPRASIDRPLADVWRSREAAGTAIATTFLQRISERVADVTADDERQRAYFGLLDRALLDRQISVHESDALVQLAEALELSRAEALRLHEAYFDGLVTASWADGVLTDAELADLRLIAGLLSIPDDRVERAVVSAPGHEAAVPVAVEGFELARGDLVVLTGEMSRPREVWEELIAARGYVPWKAVTKKVRLVVAADPDSLSGKARKARDYGIPIVDESWLVEFFG